MNPSPPIGCSKADLDTPALCLDLDVMEANIRTMAETCRRHGVAWRPHSKGHKVAAIAQAEVASGALGVTCAKLAEAELMAAGGVRDILIANMLVGEQKVRRLVGLRRVADPIVCIDHLDQALPISRAMSAAGLRLRVIIEVDIGLKRVGVPPGEATLELAKKLAGLPGIELAGIMGYEGHLLTVADADQKANQIREALATLVATKDLLERAGIPCPIVSCAGTGSYAHAVRQPGITELQAGGAIFMDAYYRHKCNVPDFDFALTVVVTIVSRPTPERAIIDAGRKTLHGDFQPPFVVGRQDIRVGRLSAEHGELELAPLAQDARIGDRLEIVPGYADLTTVLHNQYYCFRQGRLVDVWPIEGR
ncbi:MAG TPA: DSD1 family PLP-dependent enzyme, partial [Pirellulales bacterium]|nr:DSD1 family PLP-dependent enzyme [Pirellulales bacterium]